MVLPEVSVSLYKVVLHNVCTNVVCLCLTGVLSGHYAHAGAHHVSNSNARPKIPYGYQVLFPRTKKVPCFKPHRISVSSLEILLHAPHLHLRVESGTAQAKHNRDSRTYTYNG